MKLLHILLLFPLITNWGQGKINKIEALHDKKIQVSEGYNLGKGAWTVYNEPRAIRYVNTKDQTYIGYVYGQSSDADRNDIFLTSINNRTNEIITSKIFDDDSGNMGDDHINPAISVMQDGRILSMFTRHSLDANIRYIVTNNVEDVSSFKDYTIDPGGEATTYPLISYLKNENIFFCFYRTRVSSSDYRKGYIT